MLERLFHLSVHKTTPRIEFVAGVTTFLTMSYILAVNPNILGAAGMDREAVFVATCLAAACGSLIMAFAANWPVGLAPGMGLNAFFAYSVVLGMGYTWQQALGAVFVSGLVFIILTATGLRRKLLEGVPSSLRSAIIAGIGMFLAVIALTTAGIIAPSTATFVKLGNLADFAPLMALLGLFIIAGLEAWRVKGAILIGILAISLLAFITGKSEFHGLVSLPPSLAPNFWQLDISGILGKGFFHILLVFVLVEVFDATGVLLAVGTKAGLLGEGEKGKNNLDKALFADSTAILAGAVLGTSSTTAYVESLSGAAVGGRTGFTACIVGLLFVAALFFSPLILAIPSYATAPALLFVACLMMQEFAEVDWKNISNAVPAALTALMMPLTYSIANGLAFGFISYVLLKAMTGKRREVAGATWLIAALFIIRFAVE
ncbi:MAG: NCS2 family permease [Candidatus Tokpelaia sp.]|nr:MAG: NCS2 family permease [Candidatus Tokpelaia sp.]KAA6206688.1 MAG: NCS2 family permease [Candidatus Tokpelaia sp.]